ncbi:MAG: NYN domain-containing protein [Ktedonobacteraceae bacterium]
MAKEKVVFFLDYANINRAAREKRYRLDYHHLLHYVGEERFLIDAHCYVPINPRNEHRLDREIEELWRSGYIVTTKLGTIAGGTYKCNFDVEITMDILKVVYQVKPDIVVLASGDSDFVSLIQEVRKSGVRVEVAAFEETAGPDILLKCSGFINLAVYYEGYLAAQNGEQGEDSMEEQYKDLVQSQNGEQGEDSIAEQVQNLIQSQESDLDEDEVPLPVDQVGKKTTVPLSDTIDGLDLESTID